MRAEELDRFKANVSGSSCLVMLEGVALGSVQQVHLVEGRIFTGRG